MDTLSLEQKLEQFQEFFSITHAIKVSMKPLDARFVLPEVDCLVDHMPYAFQIASEAADLDVKALRPLRNLGSHAAELVNFLNHQSRKIDLMMSLILQQEEDPALTYTSYKIGGGGVVILCPNPVDIGQKVELKLFIKEESSAIFCFGEVITCQAQDDQYHVSLLFTRIREQDQDLMVRASLHLQQANLKKRHLKQNIEKN
ncbi:MAG: Tfp pilus assembly protein PilZ [Paraglaciecola sp.]|jgi:Tfp pilus assembly protein PilZ